MSFVLEQESLSESEFERTAQLRIGTHYGLPGPLAPQFQRDPFSNFPDIKNEARWIGT